MKTRITELLGIKHPIIQGAMAWVSFPCLVAAVSNAGGLGILGAGMMSPQELEENIRQVKQLTDKPFGVNLIPDNPELEELLDIVVAEKAPVVSYGIGNPQKIIERTKPEGIINMPTVGRLKHAVRAEVDGADAIVVQGHEGGGHNGPVATVVLVPLVTSKVKVPVVAAGGVVDARGLVAVLALGAEGIAMGTRFICTRESPVPANVKEVYLRADEMSTMITGHLTGVRARCLRNRLTDSFLELEAQQALLERHVMLGTSTLRKAMVEGDAEWGGMGAGQGVALIDDIPSCAELIEQIVSVAEQVLHGVSRKILSS